MIADCTAHQSDRVAGRILLVVDPPPSALAVLEAKDLTIVHIFEVAHRRDVCRFGGVGLRAGAGSALHIRGFNFIIFFMQNFPHICKCNQRLRLLLDTYRVATRRA